MMNPLSTSTCTACTAIVNGSQGSTCIEYAFARLFIASPTARRGGADLCCHKQSRATSAICSYLTFIPSACTIAGRSSHPDVQLCAHSDILGTILFNAHPLQVFKPKFCSRLTGSQGGAFGYRLGSERGLPINRVAGSNAARVHI